MDPRAKFDALIFILLQEVLVWLPGKNNLDIPDRVLLKMHKVFFKKTNVSLKLLTQILTMSSQGPARNQPGTKIAINILVR